MLVKQNTAVMFMILAIMVPTAYSEEEDPDEAEPEAREGLLDYEILDHDISLYFLRAGNHDESGTNEYFFTTKLFGMVTTKEERKLEFTKRKIVEQQGGTFGATTINALSFWKPDNDTPEGASYHISGSVLRELISNTMHLHQVHESNTAVMVEITMFEKNKKFFFFGVDTLVAKTSYFPIPQTRFDTPAGTNLDLVLKDDKGTLVKLSVKYETPTTSAGK